MIVNYKCPNCGASMVYDEGTDTMVCPYCNTSVPVSQIRQEDAKAQKDGAASGSTSADGRGNEAGPEASKAEEKRTTESEKTADGKRLFRCPNCGAEVVTDENTVATRCTFCGSPTLIEERLQGDWEPDGIIPFKLDRDQATTQFQAWTKKGLFTPRVFSSKAVMDTITGVYVPFWLYDMEAQAEVHAKGTRTRRSRRGNTEYIYTDHFDLYRKTNARYRRIPADASEKMPDEKMDALEPYNYSEIVKFELPYLSGFQAEKFNDSADHFIQRAKDRITSDMIQETRGTMLYETVTILNQDVQFKQPLTEYTLFPVWMLNYNYQGKQWILYMNGQTGKQIGTLPVDGVRVGIFVVLLAVVIFVLIVLVMTFVV